MEANAGGGMKRLEEDMFVVIRCESDARVHIRGDWLSDKDFRLVPDELWLRIVKELGFTDRYNND